MCVVNAPSAINLKSKALQLLSQREYSRAQLCAKLLQWLKKQAAMQQRLPAHKNNDDADSAAATDPVSTEYWLEQINVVLDALERKGWQSDQRAAEALLHQRGSSLGRMRLQHEMQRKGIDAETYQNLLDSMDVSELERARTVWQKKFATPASTPKEQARQMRFLASRGFAADIIYRVVRCSPEPL